MIDDTTPETNVVAEPTASAPPALPLADGGVTDAHRDAARTVASAGDHRWLDRDGYPAAPDAPSALDDQHPAVRDPGIVVARPFETPPVVTEGQPRVVDPGDSVGWPLRLARMGQ